MLPSCEQVPLRRSSKGALSPMNERSCCRGRFPSMGGRALTWTVGWRRHRCCPRSVTASSTFTASTCISRCCTRPHNGTRSTGLPEPTSSRSRKHDGSSPRSMRASPASAEITGLDEDEQLAAEESLLAQIGALRAAMAEARDALAGSDASQAHAGLGATDLLGTAVSRLAAHEALSELAVPLRAAQADVEDVARELRLRAERLEEDPDRLEAVRRRLQLFADLRRKYGSNLADVFEFERASQAHLADLEGAEETREGLEARRRSAVGLLQEAEERLGTCRRQAAPKLAAAVEAHLHELALSGRRLAGLSG